MMSTVHELGNAFCGALSFLFVFFLNKEVKWAALRAADTVMLDS